MASGPPALSESESSSGGSVCGESLFAESSRSATPPSPTRARRRPRPLRLDHIGIDPDEIIGKVLKKARRSCNHPALTLDFSDNTTFQILVDGYDPVHRGISKALEMDSSLDDLFTSGQPINLPIVDCALITLSDKAFERKPAHNPREAQWDQKHLGVAFKFAEADARWHCVWATLEDHDAQLGTCVFRSYDDVYLDRLQRSPTKPKFGKRYKNI